MKNLLRKLLRIHTLKLILFNPANINPIDVVDISKHTKGCIFIPVYSINDIKVIDTGIPIKLK